MIENQAAAERPPHVPPELVVDFDAYDPPGVGRDLQLAWKAFQDSGVPDLVWCSRNGGHWMPTRGRLIAAMWADHERFSNRISFLPKAVGIQFFGIPQSLDPPEHQPFRLLLSNLLSPKAVMRLEADIREMAVTLIESFRETGRCDFAADYANVLPVSLFLRLVDLPLEDRLKLQALNDNIIRPTNAAMSVDEANRRLNDYLRGPIEQRLGRDGTDMFSRMINGKVFGRSMTIDEAVNMAKLVLQGGIDTASNLLSFGMRFLATSKRHRRELLEHPELIPAAVEEWVRRFPVVATARLVKHDMMYEGIEMREGDVILMPTMLHGLDERENERPLDCDFHRAKREHSTFGNGIHRCPGAGLARLETRITLEEWLARIPDFELATSDVHCRGGVVGGVDALPLRWNAAALSVDR